MTCLQTVAAVKWMDGVELSLFQRANSLESDDVNQTQPVRRSLLPDKPFFVEVDQV